MRYLVAADGSEESEKAVQYASKQALTFDATLEIAHVLEPRAELMDGEIALPGGEKATEHGEEILERARQLAAEFAEEHADGLRVETQLLTGRPADAITERAEETGADAIYVGHRGLSERAEPVVGSVAKTVVDKATVPVVVTR
ncbi:MAG: universal stress protein [Halovenus sp.]